MDRTVEPRTVIKVRFPRVADGSDSLVLWTHVVYSIKRAPELWQAGCGFLSRFPDEWLRAFNQNYASSQL
jgi:hypothetical protein